MPETSSSELHARGWVRLLAVVLALAGTYGAWTFLGIVWRYGSPTLESLAFVFMAATSAAMAGFATFVALNGRGPKWMRSPERGTHV